jgi:O-antigen/teichoic acid export membrane protein
VSVASVTFYEVGSKLAFISRTLPNYLVDAVLPAAAAADAHEDQNALHRLELTASLYLLLATTIIAGFVIGACEPIMRVWLGTSYPYVAAITALMGVGYVLSSSATVGVAILRSVGRPDLEAAFVGVGAFVNLVATLVLTRAYGVVGAAAGTCIGWAAFALCYALFGRARTGRGTMSYSAAVRIVGLGAACSGALAWFVRWNVIAELFTSRLTGIAALCLSGLLYVGLFAAAGWLLGVFRFDQERIERNVGRLRRLSTVRFGRVQA